MDLINEFEVVAPIDVVWMLLTDVEEIAPCIPGFQFREFADDEYRGDMRVKVGAISMSYQCAVRFVERDDVAHRLVMTAEGREIRGSGGMSATITSALSSEDGRTKATVSTSLKVTGRIAQFGRGILRDVADRLIAQFVRCLETRLLTTEAMDASGTSLDRVRSDAKANTTIEVSKPINLVAVAGRPLLARVASPLKALLRLLHLRR